MIINLTKDEYQYLIKANFIDKSVKTILSNIYQKNDHKIQVDLPENLIDSIFVILENRLQEIGFDNNYNLTDEGSIIEKLIDKFNF